MNLNFGTSNPFDELEEDWDVLEATDDIIRLKDISGGDGTTDFLTFERNPGSNGNGGSDLDTVLVDGLWTVSSYLDDGNNETNDYNGFTFDFEADGSVVAYNGSAINGTWASQNGDNKLVLDFGDVMPLDMPDKLTVTANGVPVLKAKLGQSKGNMALQVLNKIDRNA